ncbi:QRFP-like peptide receptor [Asterias amurensis]|uniref:QRFP-like peptide receptor n=1 Tax=Asterias amurensis TaxID=7602 RepID=UPI003AB4EC9C
MGDVSLDGGDLGTNPEQSFSLYSSLGSGCDTCNSSDYGYYQKGIDWTIMAPATAAFTIIFLIGLSGNTMVIFAIHRCRRLHTVTSLLLGNLAVADLLLVLFLIPMKMVVDVLDHWPFGEVLCRVVPYLNIVSPTCSIYTLTVIALERCYAVLFPLETKSVLTMGRTRRMVAIIWMWSFLTCTPTLFSKTTRDFEMNGDEWTACNDAWASDEAALGYTFYVTVILFGFPTLVLGICYTLIVFRLYSSKRITKHMRPLSVVNMTVNRGAEQGEDGTMGISGLEGSTPEEGAERIAKKCLKRRHRRQKHDTEDDSIRRIVTMLMLVVVVFIVCWGPMFCYALLLKANLIKINNSKNTAWKISLALHIMAYGNSCTNPFIYAFVSKSFREGFFTACRSCRDQNGAKKRRGQMRSFGSGYNTRMATLTTNTTRRVGYN